LLCGNGLRILNFLPVSHKKEDETRDGNSEDNTTRNCKRDECVPRLLGLGKLLVEDDTLQGSLSKDLVFVTDLGIARLEERDDEDPAPEKRCHYEEARKT
jgi:hypothetical protein